MRRPAKLKHKLPHAFVLEALAPLNPEVRRMFSGFAVYLGNRIVCMLRDHMLMGQYEAAVNDAEAPALHIAQANWDTPDQLQFISDLRVRRR